MRSPFDRTTRTCTSVAQSTAHAHGQRQRREIFFVCPVTDVPLLICFLCLLCALAVQTVLGVLYHISSDFDKAIEAFKNAVKLKPDDPALWNKLGATQANSSRSSDAVHAYKRALQLRPAYVRTLANLAISYANQGMHEDAVRTYLTTLTHNPDANHVWSYLRISLSHLQREDLIELSHVSCTTRTLQAQQLPASSQPASVRMGPHSPLSRCCASCVLLSRRRMRSCSDRTSTFKRSHARSALCRAVVSQPDLVTLHRFRSTLSSCCIVFDCHVHQLKRGCGLITNGQS